MKRNKKKETLEPLTMAGRRSLAWMTASRSLRLLRQLVETNKSTWKRTFLCCPCRRRPPVKPTCPTRRWGHFHIPRGLINTWLRVLLLLVPLLLLFFNERTINEWDPLGVGVSKTPLHDRTETCFELHRRSGRQEESHLSRSRRRDPQMVDSSNKWAAIEGSRRAPFKTK